MTGRWWRLDDWFRTVDAGGTPRARRPNAERPWWNRRPTTPATIALQAVVVFLTLLLILATVGNGSTAYAVVYALAVVSVQTWLSIRSMRQERR